MWVGCCYPGSQVRLSLLYKCVYYTCSGIPPKLPILRLKKTHGGGGEDDGFEKQVSSHILCSSILCLLPFTIILCADVIVSVCLIKMCPYFANKDASKNDSYCWVCHDGGDVLCCDQCPRVFHLQCSGLQKSPDDEDNEWFCSICKVYTCVWAELRCNCMPGLNLLWMYQIPAIMLLSKQST